jgi:hypothetical protein
MTVSRSDRSSRIDGAETTAKPTAFSRRQHKPSGIGVPERVHFTEF